MIPASETFSNTWPFKANYSIAPGFRMHYVDEGAGDPVVLLHGEPTWGYIYRKFIGPLSRKNRVIVPDHMGFGKSETPQNRLYSLSNHVKNMAALLDDLRLRDISFVMQDWGGPIGTAYALRNPDRVKSLIYLNTAIGYGTIGRRDLPHPVESSQWFRWINEGLVTGRFNEVMRNLGTNVLSVMQIIGFDNFSIVDETFIRAYAAPFPTPAECRGAIEFPQDFLLGKAKDYVRAGFPGIPELVKKPAILLEGMRDRAILPELAIADFKGLWPNASVHEMPTAGHYCQEDEPEYIVDAIQAFLSKN